MQVASLYEQAVDLSPRAAKLAAELLVRERMLPQALRGALLVVLSACAEGADGDLRATGDDDARETCAARRFVEACQAVLMPPERDS